MAAQSHARAPASYSVSRLDYGPPAIASHPLVGFAAPELAVRRAAIRDGEHCLLVAKLPGHTIAPPEMRDRPSASIPNVIGGYIVAFNLARFDRPPHFGARHLETLGR
jgi:hypothetical protein